MYQPTHAMTIDHAQAAMDDGLRAIEAGQTQFDLANVTAVDSSSVAVLLNWQRAARKAAINLQLSGVSPSLISLIAVYGVADLLKIDAANSLARQEASHH